MQINGNIPNFAQTIKNNKQTIKNKKLMKKIFTLLTMALLAIGAQAQTLIDFSKSQTSGITLPASNVTIANVKIHKNTDNVAGIKFDKSYASENALNGNEVKLSTEGGFKAGDKLTIAGAFNNSDETKQAKVDLFVKDDSDNGYTVLFTTSAFINGRTVATDPVEETYTLKADADYLYLGRNGNTGTFVTTLKIVRGEESAVDVEFSLTTGNTIYLDETSQIQVNGSGKLDGLTMNGLSYDNNIIDVAANGLVTPKAVGSTTITFTTEAVDKKYNAGEASIDITVAERPIPDEIDYPTSKNGIKKSGTTAEATVKVLGSNVNAYKFSNGGTDNAITLTIQDGFKVGDIVTISGVISSGDATKSGKVQLLQDIAGSSVWTTENFQDVKDDNTAEPTEGTFVLKSSSEHLYLIRSGNTSVYVTKIKVVRGEAVVSHEATTWDFTKALSEADAENLEADAYWTFDEENNYWVNNSTLTERNVYTALKANDTELDITKGLTFTRDNETGLETGRIRISPTNYFAINGSAVKLNLGILAKDDVVRMRIKGAGDSERSITATNAEVTDGSLTTTDTEVHEVSLKASDDGEVVLTTGNGFQFLAITINDELPEYTPTGISVINAETKSAADAPVYNLSGQRVDENYRGVVIKNGKKMIK